MDIPTCFSQPGYNIPLNEKMLSELIKHLKKNGSKPGAQILLDFYELKFEYFAVQIQRVFRGHKCRKLDRILIYKNREKELILGIVLYDSKVPFKDDKNWQDNIFRLYIKKKRHPYMRGYLGQLEFRHFISMLNHYSKQPNFTILEKRFDDHVKEKKRCLDMVLKHSNSPSKNNRKWQDNIFSLYMTKGWGGPDYLPEFKKFITDILNKYPKGQIPGYNILKKRLDDFSNLRAFRCSHKYNEKWNSESKYGLNKRKYLNVSYNDKDEAKAMGARWDPKKKKWYYFITQNENYLELERKWGELIK